MKKMLCIVFALVLLLSAAGCGGDDGSTAGSSAATTPNGATQPSGNATTPNNDTTTPSSSAPAECTHSFSVNVAAEATCTADGEKIYTCDLCGHSYSESVAATGHSFADATCDAAKTCTVCGATEGSALSHSYTASTKEPGCTADGEKIYTCDLCGHSYSESIAATGHSYEDGSCTNCGKEDPNAFDPASVLWYDFGYDEEFDTYWIIILTLDVDGNPGTWEVRCYWWMITQEQYDAEKAESGEEDLWGYNQIIVDGASYYAHFMAGTGHEGNYEIRGNTIILEYPDDHEDWDDMYVAELEFDGNNRITCVATHGKYISESHHHFHEGDTLTMSNGNVIP